MKQREALIASLAIVLTAVAVAAVVILKDHKITLQDWSAVVIVVIVPMVVYGVLSGRLVELTAPGGFTAKFSAEAHAEIHADTLPKELTSQEIQEIPKKSPADLKRRIAVIRDGAPIVLTLTVGDGSYNAVALSYALKALAQFRSFSLVLFVDEHHTAIAYISASVLLAMLEAPGSDVATLITAVNTGNADAVSKFTGMITEFLSNTSTNIEALALMDRLNTPALIAIDSAGVAHGVVERLRLLNRMIIALASKVS